MAAFHVLRACARNQRCSMTRSAIRTAPIKRAGASRALTRDPLIGPHRKLETAHFRKPLRRKHASRWPRSDLAARTTITNATGANCELSHKQIQVLKDLSDGRGEETFTETHIQRTRRQARACGRP